MIQYKVIYSESTYGLNKEIDEWLKDGWKLQGGVAVACSNSIRGVNSSRDITIFAQAMVKEDE